MITECVRCGQDLNNVDIANNYKLCSACRKCVLAEIRKNHFRNDPLWTKSAYRGGDAKEDIYTTKHGTGR